MLSSGLIGLITCVVNVIFCITVANEIPNLPEWLFGTLRKNGSSFSVVGFVFSLIVMPFFAWLIIRKIIKREQIVWRERMLWASQIEGQTKRYRLEDVVSCEILNENEGEPVATKFFVKSLSFLGWIYFALTIAGAFVAIKYVQTGTLISITGTIEERLVEKNKSYLSSLKKKEIKRVKSEMLQSIKEEARLKILKSEEISEENTQYLTY